MEDRLLRTVRLELQPSDPKMFDGLWSAIETSLPELARWLPWAVDPNPDDTREFLAKASQAWESGSDRHFTVFKDGEFCGQCSLDHVDGWHRSAEIGYWMRSDLCGHGFMTEAATAVVIYGFWTAGLHRIELRAGVDNIGSQRIAERLGFQQEGVLRNGGLGSEGYYDSYVYGLLKTDPGPHIKSA